MIAAVVYVTVFGNRTKKIPTKKKTLKKAMDVKSTGQKKS